VSPPRRLRSADANRPVGTPRPTLLQKPSKIIAPSLSNTKLAEDIMSRRSSVVVCRRFPRSHFTAIRKPAQQIQRPSRRNASSVRSVAVRADSAHLMPRINHHFQHLSLISPDKPNSVLASFNGSIPCLSRRRQGPSVECRVMKGEKVGREIQLYSKPQSFFSHPDQRDNSCPPLQTVGRY